MKTLPVPLVLGIVVATALAGCGRKDEAAGSSASSTPAAPEPAATPPAPAAPPAAPPAAAAPAPDATTTAQATAAPGAATGGQAVYNSTCAACHAVGLTGAPKPGDKADWGPRIAKGNDTLYQHAINGFTGAKGVMPPKGGNTAVADADVRAAVDYMVSQSR